MGVLTFYYSQIDLKTNAVSNTQALLFNFIGQTYNLIIRTGVIFTVTQYAPAIFVSKING